MKWLIPICFILICGCNDNMIIDGSILHELQLKYNVQIYVPPIYEITVSKHIYKEISLPVFPAMPYFDDTNWAEIQQKYYQDCCKNWRY